MATTWPLLVIRSASLVGVAVTLYALYVEHAMEAAKKQGEQYEALCDIRSGGVEMSCTAVLGSSYGHILSHWGLVRPGSALDYSNATLGLLFYLLTLVHDKVGVVTPAILLAASAGSLLFSAYLAYVLNFILKDFCIVCTSMYVCNLAIFVAAVAQFVAAQSSSAARLKQA